MGDVLWERKYGADGHKLSFGSVEETSDGGFILSGLKTVELFADRSIYLLKTDGEGEVMWERTFDRLGRAAQERCANWPEEGSSRPAGSRMGWTGTGSS